ncbi:TOMM precursor leader peptide-binding protein [Streptomyces sp. NPDC051561]|uniref:TOMM precursor leader peptide-binding protein n=1 Tax=Streptomyces sp. NPDC051561 TaxID=3365658 RepID=UPI0037A3EC28
MTLSPTTGGLPVGFKRHLRVETVAGEAVYLLTESGTTAIHGAHVEALVPLLDGTRSLAEVLHSAAGAMPAADAGRTITELASSGLLGYRTRVDCPAEQAAHAYWDAAGLDGARTQQQVADTLVDVVALGRTDPEAARAACRAAGLDVAGPDRTAALSLVLCDDYLHPGLREVDAGHRAAGRPWLPARISGSELWVGPFFDGADPERACWSCLAHRLRGHRASQSPVRRTLGPDGALPLPATALAPTGALGLHLAVLEAVKWAAGLRGPAQRGVTRFDTLSLSADLHPVSRRPQCPDCGDPTLVARRVNAPVVPVSRPKHRAQGGNDRALPAAAVLERYRHLVSPVSGVVTEVRPADRTPDGTYHYVSGRNLALGGQGLAELRGGMRTHSGGKGTTALEAEVGALCEAVERFSGTRQGDEPAVRGTLRGLGAAALHPNDCQLYSERQLRTRDDWNTRYARSPFQLVPQPFDPLAPVDWTPLWSLTSGSQRLLPTSMLYFGPGRDGRTHSPWADSNGNAAGSSLEDALVQGFLELVERDAVALWWYNRTRHPAVDLDAFDEPWLASARRSYGRAGREVWALDLTSDFGIPVVVALSRRTDGHTEDICFGFGAHFDARLALRRAVTEMSQLLPPADAKVDRTVYAGDPEVARWWDRATLATQPYLLPDPGQVPRTPGHWAPSARGDLLDDVLLAGRLVAERGMELLVLDQTRPDTGLPVVKVVVPGMRHYWARFAPGRLFQVPVERGLLTRRTPESEVNPVPMFA